MEAWLAFVLNAKKALGCSLDVRSEANYAFPAVME